METSKSFGIIGLGKFGSVVANELLSQGKTVVIADKDENTLKELQELTSYAYVLDSTNINALKEAGFHNLDLVVVSIGENVEKSILTLMALKDLGVNHIIAKAISNIHGQILSKLGASKVVYPEKESAKRLVKEFLLHSDFEIINISANTLRAVKIQITDNLAGNTLRGIAKNMRLIGYKKATQNWELMPTLETTTVGVGDSVVLFGTQKEVEENFNIK